MLTEEPMSHPKKDDASTIRSLTIATQSLLLLCLIYTMEEEDFATVDIPGAFLRADIKEDHTHVKIEGQMALLLVKLDQKFLYCNTYNPKIGKLSYTLSLKSLIWHIICRFIVLENISASLQE